MLPSPKQRSLGGQEEHCGIETPHSLRSRPTLQRPKAVPREGGGYAHLGEQESNINTGEAKRRRLGEASGKSVSKKSDALTGKKVRAEPAPANFLIVETIHGDRCRCR